jgi:ATP/maltotriose-dependent transcriptional regulator MalT
VRLINELATLDHDIALVIADYTPTEATDCFLTFMLEHLPQQLHLYLFCDTPPKLSCIPRLRVRRQLQMIDVKAS